MNIHHLVYVILALRLAISGSSFIFKGRSAFEGNEWSYLIGCIDLHFFSSVGATVAEFQGKVELR